MRWGRTLCCLALLAVGGAHTGGALASPCQLPPAPMAELQQALGALGRTPPPKVVQNPSRWLALLPAHVSAGIRDARLEQTSWFVSETSLTQRVSDGASLAWSVRLDWDLRPLWLMPSQRVLPGESRLEHAQKAEHLAERIGNHLQVLRKAEALAVQLQEGDLLCRETQAEAEAALLVLGTVLHAARP